MCLETDEHCSKMGYTYIFYVIRQTTLTLFFFHFPASILYPSIPPTILACLGHITSPSAGIVSVASLHNHKVTYDLPPKILKQKYVFELEK